MVLEEIGTYIEDDWDDNALTNRTDNTEGYFLHPSDGLLSGDFEAGDALKGVYRPEWKIQTGSFTVADQYAESAGNLEDAISTPSSFSVGSWEADVQMVSNTGDLELFSLAFMDQDSTDFDANVSTPDNGYTIEARDNGDLRLVVRSGGSNSSITVGSSWSVDTDFHTYRATRDSYGSFELFFDGTSKGTGTDKTFNSSKDVGIYSRYGPWRFDNLVIQ